MGTGGFEQRSEGGAEGSGELRAKSLERRAESGERMGGDF